MGLFDRIKKIFVTEEDVTIPPKRLDKDIIHQNLKEAQERSSAQKQSNTWDQPPQDTQNVEPKNWTDQIQEGVEQIKSNPTAVKLKDSLEDIGSKLWEETNKITEKIAENETVQQIAHKSEEVGDKLLGLGEKVMEKSSKVGSEIADKSEKIGSEILDKLQDVKKVATEKGIEAIDIAFQKSRELEKKFEDLKEKAWQEAEEERKNPKPEFSDKDLSTGPDLLANKDDFFSKAARYAEGDHHSFSEGKIEITKTTKGMQDHDQDGDDLIDEAEIVK